MNKILNIQLNVIKINEYYKKIKKLCINDLKYENNYIN